MGEFILDEIQQDEMLSQLKLYAKENEGRKETSIDEGRNILKQLVKHIEEDDYTIEQVKDYIYDYWQDHSRWVMYAMWKYLVDEGVGDFKYNELLDIFMGLYTMGIYDSEACDDLEYLVDMYKYDSIDDEEESIIYRGATEFSLGLESCLSWTTDKDIAYWFACRLGKCEPKVITGKVKKKDIIAEDNCRNEKEVVVLPKSVKIMSIDDVTYDKDKILRIKNNKLS